MGDMMTKYWYMDKKFKKNSQKLRLSWLVQEH